MLPHHAIILEPHLHALFWSRAHLQAAHVKCFHLRLLVLLVNHSCPGDQFKCQSNRCIPKRWLCDGANDCGNNEDEFNETCSGKMCERLFVRGRKL